MRFSTLLALLGATVAMASPVHKALEKKAYYTHIVTDIVTVTVTASYIAGHPAATPVVPVPVVPVPDINIFKHKPKETKTSTKPTPPPPPPSTPPPPPAPTTTAIQEPEPEPTPIVPAPEPTTAAYRVVEDEATTPAAPDAAKPSDYKSAALWHHNCHRDNHTVARMTWDDDLANWASITANKCVWAHDKTPGDGAYGQNLAAYGSTADMASIDLSTVVADAITNQWYNGEFGNMDWGANSPAIEGRGVFLHLSQLVWKSSTRLGCATARCGPGIFTYHSLFTVCNYKSVGNVMGSFTSEVPHPMGLPGITAKIA